MTRVISAAILLAIALMWGLLLLYTIHNIFMFGGWHLFGLLVQLVAVMALMAVYWTLGYRVWKGFDNGH